MDPGYIIEPVMIGLTLFIFILYHVYLVMMIRKYPLRMASGQMEVAREHWISSIMANQDLILGVQTIRNTMMASSLLASTTIALSSIVVVLLVQKDGLSGLSSIAHFQSPGIGNGYRFFIIILFLSSAFFSYMQSLRAGNHASYLIGIPGRPEAEFYVTPLYVARVLHRGALFYTVGSRLYYLSFLAILWLFGPIPPLAACIIMICILFKTDRYPNIHREHKHNIV